MKDLCCLLIAFIPFVSDAQITPVMETEGQSISDFAPKNWKVIRTASGDLNRDSIADAAIVIQEMDPKKIIIDHDGLGTDTLDTNPRILIILFKDATSNTFKLQEISRTFILNHYSPTMDDPFDGIMISNGILEIGFHLWYSVGSWYQTFLEYKFRFQKNGFSLIGAEFQETDRGTMEGLSRSFNFSTRKMSETKTKFENDEKGEQVEKTATEWKRLDIKEPKTLKTFLRPMTWTIQMDVTI
jgi:hypothetical protein